MYTHTLPFLSRKIFFSFFHLRSLGLDRRLAVNHLGSFVRSLRFNPLALQRTRLISHYFLFLEEIVTEGGYFK